MNLYNKYDVLIVGAGVAGLYAALNFPPEVRVLLISKRDPFVSNSWLAQGGVAAVVDKENDDFKLHIADTLIAGGYRNNLRALEILVNEGPEDVLRLMKELQVDFDRDGETDSLSMTLEGGHSRRRVLHHKDSTGREIIEKLRTAVLGRPNVSVYDNTMLATLTPAKNGFCSGILINSIYQQIFISYIILCTGGIGRVYAHTTNAAIATGDGITLAYELGARLKHLSWVQFHPTAFAASQGRERFLITEAVRGEGALLLNCRGERFMERYDSRGELAPRDVVSQAIIRESRRLLLEGEAGHDRFWLDIRHRGAEFIKNRFPAIYARCLEDGVDISRELIPVYPCQHYLMGGIDTGPYGDTSVDRLYAAGECAHTGVHGINRLASNSLLEGLVFARRTTYDISRRLRQETDDKNHQLESTPLHLQPSGRLIPAGIRTTIREIMQKAWFIQPDLEAAARGLITAKEILADLRNGGYALTADFIEAKSLATVAMLILEEITKKEYPENGQII